MKEEEVIIGSSDGPTSVFVLGNAKRSGFIRRMKQKRYQKREDKIGKHIVPLPHTLDEVILYMKERYDAQEIFKESRQYIEQKSSLKCSLILQHRPELLGELQQIDRPENLEEGSLKKFLKALEMRAERANAISDEEFPMDYSMYEIQLPKLGEIHFEIEKNWEIVSCGCSGKGKREMKKLSKICKDIYLYYGVTEEDIINRSERFRNLLSMLMSP